jgi:hypothetical protein
MVTLMALKRETYEKKRIMIRKRIMLHADVSQPEDSKGRTTQWLGYIDRASWEVYMLRHKPASWWPQKERRAEAA